MQDGGLGESNDNLCPHKFSFRCIAPRTSGPAIPFRRQAGAPDEPKKEAAKPGIDKIAQCREALRKAEAEHPGNTVEVAEALDDLVASQIDASVVDTETLAEVNREVQVAKAAAGPRSQTFLNSLGVEVEVWFALNRAAEARPIAERLLETAQKGVPG